VCVCVVCACVEEDCSCVFGVADLRATLNSSLRVSFNFMNVAQMVADGAKRAKVMSSNRKRRWCQSGR